MYKLELSWNNHKVVTSWGMNIHPIAFNATLEVAWKTTREQSKYRMVMLALEHEHIGKNNRSGKIFKFSPTHCPLRRLQVNVAF